MKVGGGDKGFYYCLESRVLTEGAVLVDEDFQELRAAYIPETVLAYISCLHFAGTSLSRDNLLECMELAAVIAEKGSDVAQEFMACNRMKELVEAFASCSKALAIWTSDKKGSQTNSKKIREMGWYVPILPADLDA
jgi:nuclear pore complex protein Nup107